MNRASGQWPGARWWRAGARSECSTSVTGRSALAGLLSLFLAWALPLHAQNTSFLERVGLDRLTFISLGGGIGRIDASQADPARLYALTADYGELARNWRIVFDVSYWESRLSDKIVNALFDSLRKSIVDPTNDYSFVPSRVPLYDVTFSGSMRWQSAGAVAFRPYAGVGLSAHVINAEGPLIKGTFVERALDNIAAGFFANGGVLFRPWGRVVFDAQARGDLLSGFRSFQLRAGAHYVFGPPRRPSQ